MTSLVYVWAGISKNGATEVCIFEGIMKAPLYCIILKKNFDSVPTATTELLSVGNS